MKKLYVMHRIHTFLGLVLIGIVGIAVEFRFPIFGTVFGILFMIYLGRRESSLTQKKIRDRHEDVREITDSIDSFTDASKEYDKAVFGTQIGNKCNTCGATYYHDQNRVCLEEGIPTHRVIDTPPEDNPYADWWYQINGYPPSYVEKAQDDFVFDRKYWLKRGKEYYETHDNMAWDMGISDPPDWYVEKKVASMV